MKTLLVIAPHAGLAEAIRAGLDPGQFRVLHHLESWAAEPLLRQGSIDAVVVDADLTDVRPIRLIEHIRRASPACPLFLYASTSQWEWEEEAYLLGVDYILTKPLRARLLHSLLERGGSWRTSPERCLPPPASPHAAASVPASVAPHAPALNALRDCAGVLAHSLQTKPLLHEFLQLMREILGVNRAAIFLRRGDHSQPEPGSNPPATSAWPVPAMEAACTLGIPQQLLNHFTLSFRSGIAGHLQRDARILRRGSPEAIADPDIQREFELLGTQVALPIFDREGLLGIMLFDQRLTGDPFAHADLSLIFHLLEELGLAIRNSRLHDALSGQHAMMTHTLDQLGSAVMVIARDLNILSANHAARRLFLRGGNPDRSLTFTDLPQSLGSKVFETLRSGLVPEPARGKLPGTGDALFRMVIRPFQPRGKTQPEAALLLIDDITEADRAQQMEIEAANLRLVRRMAEQLAHEIGNSLVPISTSQQLLTDGKDDPATRKEISSIMGDSIRRVGRLARQMQFLARDGLRRLESVPLAQLIEEAFQEAHTQNPRGSARLQYSSGGQPLSITADRAGLRHALAEVLLNALQANSADQPIEVVSEQETHEDGSRWVRIEVRDAGSGFDEETAKHATEPFYSTRTVGLGLGLTVTRKILELHRGRLEVCRATANTPSTVRISLPEMAG